MPVFEVVLSVLNIYHLGHHPLALVSFMAE